MANLGALDGLAVYLESDVVFTCEVLHVFVQGPVQTDVPAEQETLNIIQEELGLVALPVILLAPFRLRVLFENGLRGGERFLGFLVETGFDRFGNRAQVVRVDCIGKVFEQRDCLIICQKGLIDIDRSCEVIDFHVS